MGGAGKKSIYEMLVDRIRDDIDRGIIAEGEQLPTCHEYAMRLGINPNTVQRAYARLQELGYAETVPRKGVYAKKALVYDPDPPLLNERIDRQLLALRKSGATREDIERGLERVYGKEEAGK